MSRGSLGDLNSLVHKWRTREHSVASRKHKPSPRFRVGKVSIYEHHGAWWVYFRDAGRAGRRKVGASRQEAEQVAAQVNSQRVSDEPTLLTLMPVTIARSSVIPKRRGQLKSLAKLLP